MIALKALYQVNIASGVRCNSTLNEEREGLKLEMREQGVMHNTMPIQHDRTYLMYHTHITYTPTILLNHNKTLICRLT